MKNKEFNKIEINYKIDTFEVFLIVLIIILTAIAIHMMFKPMPILYGG